MKTWTSILAAGVILAFAASGSAAIGATSLGNDVVSVKHAKKAVHAHRIAVRSGYGPYAYLGSTAPVGR